MITQCCPKLAIYVPRRVAGWSFPLNVGFKTPNWAHTGYMSENEIPLANRHHFRMRLEESSFSPTIISDQRIRRQGGETSGTAIAGTAAGQSDPTESEPRRGNESGRDGRRRKETGRGAFVGYEVTGWRYMGTASWHVKVWPAERPSDWIGYTVTAGEFELKMVALPQREAVLRLIRQWETEYPNSTA